MSATRPLLLLACLAVFAHCTALGAAAGEIQYPALGNLDLQEGTLEVWFTPMVELYPPDEGKYRHIFTLFSITVPDEFSANCVWYRQRHQLGLKMSMNSSKMRNGMTTILTQSPKDWQPGQPHHIAFVWKGSDMKVLADGQVIGEKVQPLPMSGSLNDVMLRFGSERGSPIILQAVRISAVARTPEQLESAQPTADLFTLLLDVLDQPPREGLTSPAIISGIGDRQGRIVGSFQFVSEPVTGVHLAAEGE